MSGKFFLTISFHEKQQDVPINGILPVGTDSKNSCASFIVVRSAPRPTSIISSKPSILTASLICFGLTFAPNWPTKDGATIA